jgi:CPA1 family monovalent cation:H+ antiporter
LQLPGIVAQLGDVSLSRAIVYGLLISLVLIITRLLCTFGASLFTRFMSRFIRVADSNPGWKGPMVAGWAGMRGVVSLAAALSIPVLTNDGDPFPQRNLILFITFVVILVTLVFQGLTLPWVIRKVKLEDRYQPLSEEQQEIIIQKKLALVSLDYLQNNHADKIGTNTHLANLLQKLKNEQLHFEEQFSNYPKSDSNNALAEQLIEEQRRLLHAMNSRSEFDEDLIRKYMMLFDLEETRIRELSGEVSA